MLVKGYSIKKENYLKNTKGFLTMSAYIINFFAGENSEKLINSFYLHQIKDYPTIIKGAPQCLEFSTKEKIFNFCFENEKVLKNFQEVLEQFIQCKNGADSKHSNFNIF